MSAWLAAALLAAIGGWLAYGPLPGVSRATGRPTRAAALLGALRASTYLLLLALLLGAPGRAGAPEAPLVVLDASESWQRADDGALWQQAVDSARARAGDSLWLAGDSARLVRSRDIASAPPSDARSALQSALDAVAALGRTALVITDGELDDAAAAGNAALAPGTGLLVLPRPPRVDVAVAEVEMPSVVTGGDTIDVHATLVNGNAPVRAGTLEITVDGSLAARTAAPAFDSAFAVRRVSLRVPVPRGARSARVEVAVAAPNDVEARNDTLALPLEVIDRPRAVFVSTAPDLDVREALRVLRGAVAVPTRAYLRVAPGVWREEGTLAAIAESEVQARAASAGLLVLHGDTLWGASVRGRQGALVLWTPAPAPPPPRAGEVARPVEWFVTGAPPSPLAAVLDALPFDALPPLGLPALATDTSSDVLLEASLGRSGRAVPLATWHREGGRRVVRVAGSGFAAWVQRGGRSADAFTALWGAIFDWTAASEGAGDGVRVLGAPLRAGESLRWQRGPADSVVSLGLRNEAGRVDSIVLRFIGAAEVAESPSLAPGVYRIEGSTAPPIIVNRSREWVPRPPVAGRSRSGDRAPTGPRRPLREDSWPFIAALLLLCTEWLVRRSAGLR